MFADWMSPSFDILKLEFLRGAGDTFQGSGEKVEYCTAQQVGQLLGGLTGVDDWCPPFTVAYNKMCSWVPCLPLGTTRRE